MIPHRARGGKAGADRTLPECVLRASGAGALKFPEALDRTARLEYHMNEFKNIHSVAAGRELGGHGRQAGRAVRQREEAVF
jgi:hypothetical protein